MTGDRQKVSSCGDRPISLLTSLLIVRELATILAASVLPQYNHDLRPHSAVECIVNRLNLLPTTFNGNNSLSALTKTYHSSFFNRIVDNYME